ncbi:MAG: formylmethanofuran dehydrogenase, partial [Proteobacteria bacterium]
MACPFCSLLCDDLTLTVSGDTHRVVKNGCPQATSGFGRPYRSAPATIDGQPASQTAAVAAAAQILKRARAPLISGLATDVEGMREAVHLAEKSRAILDSADSTSFDHNVRVLQSRGWYMTTLAEIRNRSDLVVIVGADIVHHYANFLRRVIAPKHALHPRRRRARRVVYIGAKAAAPATTAALNIECLACDPTRIAEVIGVLRALVAGRTIHAARVAKARIRQINDLAKAITAAEYPVFVWAPAHFTGAPADLAIQAITRLVDDLNQTQRAAGLSLGGDHGGMSAANVCTWLTGYPLHVSFGAKHLDYDPIRYRTPRLLEDDAIDTLVWIDAFGQAAPPATRREVKRIVIGLPGSIAAIAANVFIPIGSPGVDHRGSLIRTDSVV